jgi:twitching motility protein PilT
MIAAFFTHAHCVQLRIILSTASFQESIVSNSTAPTPAATPLPTVPTAAAQSPNPLQAATENFHRVLVAMTSVSGKVSDLIFSPGRPPQVELNSRLTPVNIPGLEMLTPDHTATIAAVLTQSHRVAAGALQEAGAADLSYSVPNYSRFRVNIFKQRGSHAIVMRVINPEIPNFDKLNLPVQLKQIAELKNGIVLVTGPTGSGKSSTLAAIIDYINETRYDHILTIEDPIEFMHRHKNCTIHQRELHADTPSFSQALRAALRQAPKVILVGEMRDRETVEIAMEAAETGHLVLSTLHTIDASKTIDRIIGVFPKNEEPIIRTRLSQSFRFIISQRLIPRKDDKGRVAAIEILKSTTRTKEYIEKGERDGKSLLDAIRDGELEGMQSFDQVLERYVRDGSVALQTALEYATNRNNFSLQLQDWVASQKQPAAPTTSGGASIQIEKY